MTPAASCLTEIGNTILEAWLQGSTSWVRANKVFRNRDLVVVWAAHPHAPKRLMFDLSDTYMRTIFNGFHRLPLISFIIILIVDLVSLRLRSGCSHSQREERLVCEPQNLEYRAVTRPSTVGGGAKRDNRKFLKLIIKLILN